jgi:hypothetical protein
MLIRSIKINNLLSFGQSFSTLKLRPLNVLIGPNGAGKSNLLDGRGRNAAYPAPPAQIRTCRITAYGSYLG